MTHRAVRRGNPSVEHQGAQHASDDPVVVSYRSCRTAFKRSEATRFGESRGPPGASSPAYCSQGRNLGEAKNKKKTRAAGLA
jgi:hypothetical protein